MKVTIVFNDNAFDNRLTLGHGFSCLIEFNNKNILFDTGSESPTLINNMKRLAIDPLDIDYIFLSHIHDDHTGGLLGVLELNSTLTVCLLKSFPDSFKERVKSFGAMLEEVEESREILPSVYTTGELGKSIKEQSLIIDTHDGIVIITGCAHPGILEIIEKSKHITSNMNVSLVIGGFHLYKESGEIVQSVVDNFTKLGVAMIAPSHCSGEVVRRICKKQYEENYIESGVGKIIEI